MNSDRANKWAGWQSILARIVTVSCVVVIGAGILAPIILWDADFYTARDRWEHFKLAMFGEWQSQNWCPPGRNTENCKQVSEFEMAFKDVDDFNFFKSVPVTETLLTIVTGINFASARNVLSGTTAKHWCYFTFGRGKVQKRLDLGSQKNQSAPVFADLIDISSDDLGEIGLSAVRLRAIAKSHCRFGAFNPKDGKE